MISRVRLFPSTRTTTDVVARVPSDSGARTASGVFTVRHTPLLPATLIPPAPPPECASATDTTCNTTVRCLSISCGQSFCGRLLRLGTCSKSSRCELRRIYTSLRCSPCRTCPRLFSHPKHFLTGSTGGMTSVQTRDHFSAPITRGPTLLSGAQLGVQEIIQGLLLLCNGGSVSK